MTDADEPNATVGATAEPLKRSKRKKSDASAAAAATAAAAVADVTTAAAAAVADTSEGAAAATHPAEGARRQAVGGNGKMRCYNCGKMGHASKQCDKPAGRTACHLCGEEGHKARACPTAALSEPAAARCYNCGAHGHLSASCPKPKAGAGNCHKCGKPGHTARYCRAKPQPGEGAAVDAAAVEALVAKRAALRAAKDWAAADAIKLELKGMGVRLRDDEGTWTASL